MTASDFGCLESEVGKDSKRRQTRQQKGPETKRKHRAADGAGRERRNRKEGQTGAQRDKSEGRKRRERQKNG